MEIGLSIKKIIIIIKVAFIYHFFYEASAVLTSVWLREFLKLEGGFCNLYFLPFPSANIVWTPDIEIYLFPVMLLFLLLFFSIFLFSNLNTFVTFHLEEIYRRLESMKIALSVCQHRILQSFRCQSRANLIYPPKKKKKKINQS